MWQHYLHCTLFLKLCLYFEFLIHFDPHHNMPSQRLFSSRFILLLLIITLYPLTNPTTRQEYCKEESNRVSACLCADQLSEWLIFRYTVAAATTTKGISANSKYHKVFTHFKYNEMFSFKKIYYHFWCWKKYKNSTLFNARSEYNSITLKYLLCLISPIICTYLIVYVCM